MKTTPLSSFSITEGVWRRLGHHAEIYYRHDGGGGGGGGGSGGGGGGEHSLEVGAGAGAGMGMGAAPPVGWEVTGDLPGSWGEVTDKLHLH